MINRIYSILAAGDTTSTRFSRFLDTAAYRPSGTRAAEARVLSFPDSDAGYRQYAAGLLTDICFRSMLAKEAALVDPTNTYGSWPPAMVVTDTVTALPTGVTVELTEPDVRHDWADMLADVVVNPAFNEITINGVLRSYTFIGGKSAPVPLFPGILLSLRGLAVTPFDFTIECARVPRVDLDELKISLDKASPGWKGPYLEYKNSGVTTDDWLAAFVLDYCGTEGAIDG